MTLDDYQKQLEQDPYAVLAWHGYLGLLLEEGHLLEMRSKLEKMLQLLPESREAWVIAGNIFRKTGDFTKAKDCYEQAFHSHFNNKGILSGLIDCYENLGEEENLSEIQLIMRIMES